MSPTDNRPHVHIVTEPGSWICPKLANLLKRSTKFRVTVATQQPQLPKADLVYFVPYLYREFYPLREVYPDTKFAALFTHFVPGAHQDRYDRLAQQVDCCVTLSKQYTFYLKTLLASKNLLDDRPYEKLRFDVLGDDILYSSAPVNINQIRARLQPGKGFVDAVNKICVAYPDDRCGLTPVTPQRLADIQHLARVFENPSIPLPSPQRPNVIIRGVKLPINNFYYNAPLLNLVWANRSPSGYGGRKRVDVLDKLRVPGLKIFRTEGQLSDSDLQQKMLLSDGVIITAEYEAGPACLYEALALGKLVFAPTGVGGVDEFFSLPNLIRYPVGDVDYLTGAIESAMATRRMSRQKVSEHTEDAWVRDHELIFADLLGIL